MAIDKSKSWRLNAAQFDSKRDYKMEQLEQIKAQLTDILQPIYQSVVESLKPAIDAYAPYHAELSKPIIGPFSSYFAIIIVIQILVNFWPSGGKRSVTASHILVKDEATCKQLKEKIAKGASFEEVAKSSSTCPSSKNGGKLGSFGPGSMVAEFDRVCFDPDTEVGKVYGPVKTQFGYHLIKVTSRPTDQDGKVKKD